MQPGRSDFLPRSRGQFWSLALLVTGVLVQLACGSGGSDAVITPPVLFQPAISSFVATPSTITSGQTATLSFAFSNGTGSINQSVGAVTTGVSKTVSPTTTTTYALTVTGDAGTTPATQTATVTVVPPPVISSFTATPATISSGSTSKLNAVFSGGTGLVTPGNLAMTSGVDLTVGPLSATTAYTLTVTNSAGGFVTAPITVTVSTTPQPAISSFVATPSTITSGQTSTLSFAFSNGTGSINQSVGAVTSGVSKSVSPTTTTIYTLTVTGGAGTTPATQTATVTVSGSSTRTVTGTVTYDFVPAIYDVVTKAGTLNFAGATQKPVRNGIIAVMNGSTALTTGNTDASGHYSLTFTPLPAAPFKC